MGDRYDRSWQLKKVSQCLYAGGVIAYPTEAIWGLGCDPYNRAATYRLLQIKQRPVHKGLILVASSPDQLEPLLASLNPTQLSRVLASWPGPTTWLIPDHHNCIPSWVKGMHSSVAIRVSAHPQVSAMCHHFGGPIVSTSANRAGASPAKTAIAVQKQMGNRLDGIFFGQLGDSHNPSTIIDAVTGQVFR